MENNLYQQVVNLVSSKQEFLKKIKVERFKNKWLVDVVLNNTMLNIVVSNIIVVDINNAMNQFILDFYKNEKTFNTFDEFETFLNGIIKGYKEKTSGLYATYNGEEYLCEIEIISVDTYRQMGVETLYEISFTDNEGNTIKAAQISEYPKGAFSIYNVYDNVAINEPAVYKYFMNHNEENEHSEYQERFEY